MKIFRSHNHQENRIAGLEARIGFIEAKFSILENALNAFVDKGMVITVRDARKPRGPKKKETAAGVVTHPMFPPEARN